ncbi:hypothetical protein [Sulfurospirillum sp. MES]|uniref:hypothetical protein n=1 Tax=Sulfurospirillum sp. MES TaxID=1565314 RepID=UPI000543B2B9|nr:hypothetical protein [Sulfurospirillum sp. MES]KHG32967.1 MAG: hypothetical protein OA34_12270 [Sulfurospirillum sp. MES]
MSTTLKDLAMMSLPEIRQWIALNTKGKHYIPNYASYGYSAKGAVEDGLLNVQDEILMDAIKGTHKRVDSRSLTIANAAQKGDFFTVAATLASAHRTYMANHGFKSNSNKTQFTLSVSAQLKEEEIAQAKSEMIALQMNKIGAIVRAQKTHKKGTLQACLDFEESEYILNLNKMNGDLSFADLAPEVSF